MQQPSRLSFLIHEPGGAPRQVPIEPNLGLGRGAACECTLRDQAASSWHAIVKWVEGRLALIDLGSTNHTKVRGGPTLGRGDYLFLESGQEFLMGRTVLTVHELAAEPEGTLPLESGTWRQSQEETALETDAPQAAGSRTPGPAPAHERESAAHAGGEIIRQRVVLGSLGPVPVPLERERDGQETQCEEPADAPPDEAPLE